MVADDNQSTLFRYVSVECLERLDSLRGALQRGSQAALQTAPGLSSRTPLSESTDTEPELQHRTLSRYSFSNSLEFESTLHAIPNTLIKRMLWAQILCPFFHANQIFPIPL